MIEYFFLPNLTNDVRGFGIKEFEHVQTQENGRKRMVPIWSESNVCRCIDEF